MILVSAGCLMAVIFHGTGWAQGMMGMRGGGSCSGMRGMMQRMMGDILPPLSPAQLPDPNSGGAQLLNEFCTQCHNLPGPGLHTAAQWPAVMERMNRRMQGTGQGGMMSGCVQPPNPQEYSTILAYLQENAQKPLAHGLSPYLESEAGQAFHQVCSQCHPLPSPSQHTAAQWPSVVARMRGYMTSSGRAVPTEKKMSEIIKFLQEHSSSDK